MSVNLFTLISEASFHIECQITNRTTGQKTKIRDGGGTSSMDSLYHTRSVWDTCGRGVRRTDWLQKSHAVDGYNQGFERNNRAVGLTNCL